MTLAALEHRTLADDDSLLRRWMGTAAHPTRTAIALLLALLAGIVYSNSFTAGYTLDNGIIIAEDPRLSALTKENLYDIFTRNYWWPRWESDLYRPLTTLSYLLNFQFTGGNRAIVWPIHAVNLILHYINALLVFAVCRRVIGSTWPAFFIAAVFTIHPLATETVTNMVGRADLFVTLFVMLGLYLHIRLRDGFRPRWLALTILGGGALIGVFCKESAVVLIGLILLYDLCFTSRPDEAGGPRLLDVRGFVRTFLGGAWMSYVAVIPSLIAIFAARKWLLHATPVFAQTGCDNPLAVADFTTARITALGVIGDYLRLIFWPATLSADYSYDQIPVFSWSLSNPRDLYTLIVIALLIPLGLAILWYGRRNRALLFFVGIFVVVFFPTSNLPIIVGTIMGERFMYLPIVGVVGALMVTVVPWLLSKLRATIASPSAFRFTVATIAAALLIGLGVRAYIRNFDWKSNVTLWTAANRACPNSHKTYSGLANALWERDRGNPNLEEVAGLLRKAQLVLEAKPLPPAHRPGKIYDDYAEVAMRIGDNANRLTGATLQSPNPLALTWYNKAHESILKAVEIDSAVNAESRESRLKRGIPLHDIADVGNFHIHITRGEVARRLGRSEEAQDAYRYARRLEPARSETHLAEGLFHLDAGRLEEAAVLFLQALVLDGRRQDVWQAYANIYRQLTPNSPAVGFPGGNPVLNIENPLVPKHITAALYGLAQLLANAKRWTDVQFIADLGQERFKIPRSIFEPVLAQKPRS